MECQYMAVWWSLTGQYSKQLVSNWVIVNNQFPLGAVAPNGADTSSPQIATLYNVKDRSSSGELWPMPQYIKVSTSQNSLGTTELD